MSDERYDVQFRGNGGPWVSMDVTLAISGVLAIEYAMRDAVADGEMPDRTEYEFRVRIHRPNAGDSGGWHQYRAIARKAVNVEITARPCDYRNQAHEVAE